MINPFKAWEERRNALESKQNEREAELEKAEEIEDVSQSDESSAIESVDEDGQSELTEEELELVKRKRFRSREVKRAAARRRATRQRLLDEFRQNAAKLTIQYLADCNVYDTAPEDIKKFLDSFNKTPSKTLAALTRARGPYGFYAKMFGKEGPEVGDNVTLLEAYQRTLRDKTYIDRLVKRWRQNGIIVQYEEDQNQPLSSIYRTIAVDRNKSLLGSEGDLVGSGETDASKGVTENEG